MNQQQNDQIIAQMLLEDKNLFELCVWVVNGYSERAFFLIMKLSMYERQRLQGKLAFLQSFGLNKEIVEKVNTVKYAEAIRKIKPKKD